MRAPVGILETGVPPADLAERHGRYDAMVRRLLGPDFSCETYDVQAGALPARPEDHRAYVITGSSSGVYDPLPWIAPLTAFIQAAQGRARLVGLCFGHQLIAQALGGRVERSDKGWGLGLHRYAVAAREPWMDDRGRIAVAASHQDQVVAAPEGARVILRSAFTPFAGLAYAGGEAMSVQFHPEFSHAFAAALVERRRDVLTPEAARSALESLAGPGDAAVVGGWIRRFIGVVA